MSIKAKIAVAVSILIAIAILPFTGGMWKSIWESMNTPAQSICVKDHSVTTYGYFYGYNPFNGKFEWHYGPDTEVVCDKTIINPKWVEWKRNHGK
jgi:hypothetical protein